MDTINNDGTTPKVKKSRSFLQNFNNDHNGRSASTHTKNHRSGNFNFQNIYEVEDVDNPGNYT